jgi:hypothetical protein
MGATVYLERYYSSAWQKLKSQSLNSASGYSFFVKPAQTGKFKYRVYKPAAGSYLAGYSHSVAVSVT